jgi:hypothetical protein
LGGLVIKQALLTAVHNDRVYGDIKASTRCLVFFGTPHRGGNNVGLGKVASNIVTAISGGVNNNLLDYLAKDSLLTEYTNDDFRHQWTDYEVVTFFEKQPTKLKGAGVLGTYVRAMVVEEISARLNIPQETAIPVETDHTNLNKFVGRDQFYEPVGGQLRRLVRQSTLPKPGAASAETVHGGYMNARGCVQQASMGSFWKSVNEITGLAVTTFILLISTSKRRLQTASCLRLL